MSSENKNIILFVSPDFEEYSDLFHELENNGYDLIVSNSSTEALSNITYKVPNIIISDTILKDDTGYGFCKKIRNSIKTKLIPFIFLAEENNELERIKAIQQGADAYLVKPINANELLAYIESKINQFNEFYLLSITDELTRLYNRREFIKKFNSEITIKPESVISLSILDLDFFKQVNDVHGHQMGDIVLMKLAEILKKNTSENFFPTRFGGEEFVIIFPGLGMHEAKKMIDQVRTEFYGTKFTTTNEKNFRVSFSAGVAEYPEIGKNLSILLSRADQALYAAKKDGRARTYIFSPVMARNDQFWEYLKSDNGYFLGKKSKDAVTSLPFLPQLLEMITSIEFEISSIGVITVRLSPVVDLQSRYGNKVYSYALENIKFIIQKSCENYFASDTYIGISDYFEYEFTILFPSLVDFALNAEKCKNLYGEIISEIEKRMGPYPIEVSYSTGVLYYHKNDPRKLLSDLNRFRKTANTIKEKSSLYHIISAELNDSCSEDASEICECVSVEFVYDIKSGKRVCQLLAPSDNRFSFLSADIFINTAIKDIDKIESIYTKIEKIVDKSIPLIIPMNDDISYEDQIDCFSKIFDGYDLICTITEYSALKIDIKKINDFIDYLPENMKPGLSNCFISNEILNLLSMCDFEYIGLSEHLTRNIHFFRDRIKIINGLKIFADQMDIQTAAFRIYCEEELQILDDLDVLNMHGNFINDDCLCR